jgi:hypothetical protein
VPADLATQYDQRVSSDSGSITYEGRDIAFAPETEIASSASRGRLNIALFGGADRTRSIMLSSGVRMKRGLSSYPVGLARAGAPKEIIDFLELRIWKELTSAAL